MFKTGWIPPNLRTKPQEQAHEDAMQLFDKRFLIGKKGDVPNRLLLTDFWSHPEFVKKFGDKWLGTHQFSGSCVWAGFQDVMLTLNIIEVHKFKEPEQLVIPFGLVNYGRSRLYMGDRGPGEGSLGSTMFRSAKEDGTPNNHDHNLPLPIRGDGMEWGERNEMSWSDGDTRQTMDLLPHARKHLIKGGAELRTTEELKDSIANFYPCTIASNYFLEPASCRVKGSGENACAVADGLTQGGHQTKIMGYWEHPELGLLFLNMNNWGLRAYLQDPSGCPLGGCWQTEKSVQKMLQADGELFRFSQWDGFPEQSYEIDWDTFGGWT